MKKYYFLIFPILMACGGQEESSAVDFDDFAGNTGVVEEDSLIIETDTTLDLSTNIGRLIYAMSNSYDTSTISTAHALDRFRFSKSKKVQFIGQTEVPYGKSIMVTPLADLFYYSFVDTNKTINAFYNYLDVLSESGESEQIKLQQDVTSIKSPPMFMVVYDTMIVSAKFWCEHEANNWGAFQDSILSVYGENYRYQINIGCGGPLEWK